MSPSFGDRNGHRAVTEVGTSSSINERQAMSDQLKAISYTDEAAKEIVKKFCDHVHWLVRVRHIFKVLFEDEQPSCQTLMEQTASSFFVDPNRILHNYLLLECAKISDPATTQNQENLTVNYLVRKISWREEDNPKELESWRKTTEDFRSHIKRARNKLLAHLDTAAVLSSTPLGESPEGEDKRFFDALQKICNITHKACFGTIYGDMSTVTCGDVIKLRKTLKDPVAFEKALSESSGETKTWLLLLWQKAGHEPRS
jgi:hypothetical protein